MPIEPYSTNSIVVHIGQRYNIVVQAKEKSEIGDGNFWIRTITCYTESIKHGPGKDWMKTGIVRYNNQSTDDPTDQTSKPWPFPQICDDEPLGNIRPKHKWTVGPSKNSITQGENIAVDFTSNATYIHADLLWNIKETKSSSKQNFQIDYNDPIFLRLADPKPRPEEVVVYSSENYTANDWVCQISCRICPFYHITVALSLSVFIVFLSHRFCHLFSLHSCLNHLCSFSSTTCRTVFVVRAHQATVAILSRSRICQQFSPLSGILTVVDSPRSRQQLLKSSSSVILVVYLSHSTPLFKLVGSFRYLSYFSSSATASVVFSNCLRLLLPSAIVVTQLLQSPSSLILSIILSAITLYVFICRVFICRVRLSSSSAMASSLTSIKAYIVIANAGGHPVSHSSPQSTIPVLATAHLSPDSSPRPRLCRRLPIRQELQPRRYQEYMSQ